MKKTLEMVFRNQAGKEVTINLVDPRDDLTKAQAETVMKDIVAKNIFNTKGGDLVQVVEAKISTKDSISLA